MIPLNTHVIKQNIPTIAILLQCAMMKGLLHFVKKSTGGNFPDGLTIISCNMVQYFTKLASINNGMIANGNSIIHHKKD